MLLHLDDVPADLLAVVHLASLTLPVIKGKRQSVKVAERIALLVVVIGNQRKLSLKGKVMEKVVIVTFKAQATTTPPLKQLRKVQEKLDALFGINRSVTKRVEGDLIHFETNHGISENDRQAHENIIRGLIQIFGDN